MEDNIARTEKHNLPVYQVAEDRWAVRDPMRMLDYYITKKTYDTDPKALYMITLQHPQFQTSGGVSLEMALRIVDGHYGALTGVQTSETGV